MGKGSKYQDGRSRQVIAVENEATGKSSRAAGHDPKGGEGVHVQPLDPYGEVADCLVSEQDLVRHYSEDIVEAFYQTLMREEGPKRILDLLTDSEMAHLKLSQARYLTHILSPTLSREDHMAMAMEVGLRHTWVGLSADSLAQSFQIYRGGLRDTLDSRLANDDLVRDIIIERLSNDLSWQLMAYTGAEHERARAMEEIGQIFMLARNREDLLREMLARIIGISGIVGAAVMAMPRDQSLRCEQSVGKTLHGNPAGDDADCCPLVNENPLLKAWRGEEPWCINSIAREAGWGHYQPIAQSLGLRSALILPILGRSGAPQVLLVLYSPWPGYFQASWQQSYWRSINRQLGGYLEVLEKAAGPGLGNQPVSLQDRRHYRHLLSNGSVEMWYQPVVDPGTHQIVKAEALARLRDGDRIISPYYFLPAFGSAQLLTLFEEGLRQIKKDAQSLVAEGGLPPAFSINLPPEAFQNVAFLERIADWGRAHLAPENRTDGQSPLSLTLEVLETGVLDEVSAREQIALLRQAGFRIALDDVGSGESSLSRLRSLPIDEIKIDQSFVRALEKNPDDIDFVLILADLAGDLNLVCVAEGVETTAIADMLGSIGQLVLQGYVYAKPMPAGDWHRWVEDYRRSPEPVHPHTIHGWYARWMAQSRAVRAALLHMPHLLDGLAQRTDIHIEVRNVIDSVALIDVLGPQIMRAYNRYWLAINVVVANRARGWSREASFAPLNLAEQALKRAVHKALGLAPAKTGS